MKKQKFGAHAKTEGGEYLRVTCAEGHSVVQIEESIPSFLDPRSDTVEKAWLTMSLLYVYVFLIKSFLILFLLAVVNQRPVSLTKWRSGI